MDKHREHHDSVYSQDTPMAGAYGWIQWKGTNACVDIHCTCGHHGHVDADFFYHYRCPVCGAVYAVGQVVRLIPLTPDQVRYAEEHLCGPISDVIEEDGDDP